MKPVKSIFSDKEIVLNSGLTIPYCDVTIEGKELDIKLVTWEISPDEIEILKRGNGRLYVAINYNFPLSHNVSVLPPIKNIEGITG